MKSYTHKEWHRLEPDERRKVLQESRWFFFDHGWVSGKPVVIIEAESEPEGRFIRMFTDKGGLHKTEIAPGARETLDMGGGSLIRVGVKSLEKLDGKKRWSTRQKARDVDNRVRRVTDQGFKAIEAARVKLHEAHQDLRLIMRAAWDAGEPMSVGCQPTEKDPT